MGCALNLLPSGLRANPANTLGGDTAGDLTAEVRPGSSLVNASFRLDRKHVLTATRFRQPQVHFLKMQYPPYIFCNTFGVALDAAAIVTPAGP